MSTTDDVADPEKDQHSIEPDEHAESGGRVTGHGTPRCDPDRETRTADREAVVADLEAVVSDLADRVEQLEATVAERESRIDALEDELADEREARAAAIRDEQIQRTQIVQKAKSDLRDEIDDLREDLVAEQKTRSRSDALIEKRVTHLADELDADVDEATVSGDKLVRLVRCGPNDVVDRVYPVHERARELLVNASEWGRVVSDENGRRLLFLAPDVNPYLEARFDRSFSTSEVERVFSKLAELAADSPRRIRKDKSCEGYHRLVVWKPGPLLSAAEDLRD